MAFSADYNISLLCPNFAMKVLVANLQGPGSPAASLQQLISDEQLSVTESQAADKLCTPTDAISFKHFWIGRARSIAL
jgi:hypothetical protein